MYSARIHTGSNRTCRGKDSHGWTWPTNIQEAPKRTAAKRAPARKDGETPPAPPRHSDPRATGTGNGCACRAAPSWGLAHKLSRRISKADNRPVSAWRTLQAPVTPVEPLFGWEKGKRAVQGRGTAMPAHALPADVRHKSSRRAAAPVLTPSTSIPDGTVHRSRSTRFFRTAIRLFNTSLARLPLPWLAGFRLNA